MSGFRFAEPQFVHLLWGVVLALAALFWLEYRGGRALSRFVSGDLQSRLVARPTSLRRGLRLALLGLSAVCLVLALMRPQWGLELIRTPRVGAEIMICLDVSRSMGAEDVAPNRLERAKAEIRDLLGYLDGDQVGLIAFAGRAAVLSPLTPDFGFLRLVLDGLRIGSVRPGGTRLEEPIRKAVAGFGEVGDASRVILLITDGEDHGSFPVDAAVDAAEQGVTILAVGFGDEAGSEIRVTDPATGARALLRDSGGGVVRSRLDGDTLREIALATGGAYIPAGTGVLDLESIFEAHIKPLMRGQVETRGRSVQQEGYQWPVLLALLALFASVATNARAASLGLALVLLGSSPVYSGVAIAQTQPDSESAAPAALLGDGEPDATASDESLEKLEVPDDPRDAYNRALDELTAGRLDDAERLLEAARANAKGDGEARYRATYNLGWLSVRRADALLASEPEAALQSLERAADWFREAVAMRSAAEEPRRNLEIVLQRALLLADQLNAQGERDVATELDALIERQRAALAGIRGVVDSVAGSDDPDALTGMRRVFRVAAVEEREVLSDSAALARFAGDELTALEAVAEAERSPEDGMRVAQLSGLLHYVHRARERIGQARSQLRQRRAEHAFRRAAAGLSSLKRARDQLRDPVTVLDSLLLDSGRQSVETRALLGSQHGLGFPVADGETAPPPDWLTPAYLSEAQEDLAGRTGELQSRLHSGLASLEDAPPEQGDGAQMLAALREAEPLVRQAHDAMLEAHRELSDERLEPAVIPQARAALYLAQARERFLDLKGLIELAHADQQRVTTLVASTDPLAPEVFVESLPALAELQQANVARLERLGPLLDLEEAKLAEQAGAQEQGDPDPDEAAKQTEQRRELFETARAIVAQTSEAMQSARAALVALQEQGSAAAPPREQASQALQGLAQLRRLFFSILEHLRETAERQLELGDDTEEAVGLAESEPEETARRIGPLVPRQDQLAQIAEQIALGLHEQALASPQQLADDPQIDEQQAQEVTQRMTEAAELVIAGQEAMTEASAAMQIDPPATESVRERQTVALEKLLAALQLLTPPQQDEQQQDAEQQQQEQQQQEQQQAAAEQAESPAEQAADPSQMLQAVRDREAQRHRERSEREPQAYEAVEKDW